VVKQEGVGPIHNEKDQRKMRVRGRSSPSPSPIQMRIKRGVWEGEMESSEGGGLCRGRSSIQLGSDEFQQAYLASRHKRSGRE